MIHTFLPSEYSLSLSQDEDEAIELSLPHVEEWKRVREHAIIVTGVNTWVPQKVYQPFTEADRKRYIQECQLKETILFVSSAPSEWGVGLEDALKVRLKDLRDKDDPMFEGCGPSVSIRIEVRFFSFSPIVRCIRALTVAWVSLVDQADPHQ